MDLQGSRPRPRERVLVAELREAWNAIVTCTEPVDRPCAEALLGRVYIRLGLPLPQFVWCDSPMAAHRAIAAMRRRRISAPELIRRLARSGWRAASEHARNSPSGPWLGGAVQASLSALRASLNATSESGLLSAMEAPERWIAIRHARNTGGLMARHTLDSAIERAMRASPRGLSMPPGSTFLQGRHDPNWIGYHLLWREVFGLPDASYRSDELNNWVDLPRLGMWWPFREACFVSERPAEIHAAGLQTLHREDGPVIRFRDGWSVWALGGFLVDEQLVLRPETQSVRQIRREANPRIRRIRIERLGWDRYLSKSGAVVIDSRRNDVEATRETLVQIPRGERLLVCACPSTARVHALEVPPMIWTCGAAQAWLSGGLAGRIINAA